MLKCLKLILETQETVSRGDMPIVGEMHYRVQDAVKKSFNNHHSTFKWGPFMLCVEVLSFYSRSL